MKLLIVDDNDEMRREIIMFLGDLMEEIFESEDGDEALDAYRACQPDWVLIDVKMRRVDGFEATRRIKAEFPDARIVILSQYGNVELRETAAGAGALDYVLKDDLVRLRSIIR
jgi:CheY-like chemotaxis protein